MYFFKTSLHPPWPKNLSLVHSFFLLVSKRLFAVKLLMSHHESQELKFLVPTQFPTFCALQEVGVSFMALKFVHDSVNSVYFV